MGSLTSTVLSTVILVTSNGLYFRNQYAHSRTRRDFTALYGSEEFFGGAEPGASENPPRRSKGVPHAVKDSGCEAGCAACSWGVLILRPIAKSFCNSFFIPARPHLSPGSARRDAEHVTPARPRHQYCARVWCLSP